MEEMAKMGVMAMMEKKERMENKLMLLRRRNPVTNIMKKLKRVFGKIYTNLTLNLILIIGAKVRKEQKEVMQDVGEKEAL